MWLYHLVFVKYESIDADEVHLQIVKLPPIVLLAS